MSNIPIIPIVLEQANLDTGDVKVRFKTETLKLLTSLKGLE